MNNRIDRQAQVLTNEMPETGNKQGNIYLSFANQSLCNLIKAIGKLNKYYVVY